MKIQFERGSLKSKVLKAIYAEVFSGLRVSFNTNPRDESMNREMSFDEDLGDIKVCRGKIPAEEFVREFGAEVLRKLLYNVAYTLNSGGRESFLEAFISCPKMVQLINIFHWRSTEEGPNYWSSIKIKCFRLGW